MSTIEIDGLNEEEFRRSIENRLREGRIGAALERLRANLAPYAGPDRLLPERFLKVESSDLVLSGWNTLADALRRHDQPGRPVTALSIAFAWPEDGPHEADADGRLKPYLETSFYNDNAWPFSRSAREDLLEGYSFYGCSWSGDSIATDAVLWLEGADDLHGALARLEAELLARDEPDEEGVRAGSLGACLLSTLLVQAVADRIASDGLPRPLCVMAGSNGVYPYFDAPVAGMPEEARKAAEAEDELVIEVDRGIPAPRYSSLLVTGIPRGRKRPALVLEESAEDHADRLARLRGLTHADTVPDPVPADGAPGGDAHFTPAEVAGSPLLAKKPSGQSWDFRDLLGPREPEPAETEQREPEFRDAAGSEPGPAGAAAWTSEIADGEVGEADFAVPAGHAGPSDAPAAREVMVPDLQQRLQSLIAAKTRPVAETPWPEEAHPGDPPDGEALSESGAAVAAPAVPAAVASPADGGGPASRRSRPGLREWLGGLAGALRARLRRS